MSDKFTINYNRILSRIEELSINSEDIQIFKNSISKYGSRIDLLSQTKQLLNTIKLSDRKQRSSLIQQLDGLKVYANKHIL